MSDNPLPESDIAEDGAEADNKRLREVHQRALQRADEVIPPQLPNRAEMLEDRRFTVVTGAMWEGPYGELYEYSPRPEIDLITKNMEKIEEDYRQNRVTVDFLPRGDADEDTADLLDGMYRADFNHFGCQEATDNAFKEALAGGLGAWRVSTDYADPMDPDRDEQRIIPAIKIVDADQSVFFYGGQRNDGADAKAAFIITADLRSVAEQEWGANNIDSWPLAKGWGWTFEWYRPDLVYKAEYYEVEEVPDTVLIFTQPASGEEQRHFKSEIADGFAKDLKAQGWKLKQRPWKRKRVHKYILNGCKVLRDCGYIAGPNIPIVVVYGRVDWIDGVPRYRGYVRKQKDAQRTFNAKVAKLNEIDALAPYEVPIVAPEQMTPQIAEQWAEGNIKRHPFRYLMPLMDPATGGIASQGPIGKIEPPQVPTVTANLLQFSMSILANEDDQTDQVKANTSADAMDIAASRVDAKSGIWLDNNEIAHKRNGEIYAGMAAEIYYEPGREVDTQTVEGQFSTSELSEPVIDDRNVYRLRHDLSKGRFGVVASVTETTDTKKQRAVRTDMNIIAAVAQVAPDIASAVALHALANVSGEGSDDLNRFARQKGLAIGLFEPTPEEKQELEQAQQQQQGQPDPQAIALQSAVQAAEAKANLDNASAQDKQASAHLKDVQAIVLQNPPQVATGLGEPANDPAETISKLASAKLNDAKADHLQHDMQHKSIMRGHEITQAEHDREMDRRQQDHAERTAQQGRGE